MTHRLVAAARTLCAVGLAAAACRPDAGASAPAPLQPPGPRPSHDPTAEIELALGDDQLCIRVGGRVHCGSNTDPRRSPLDEPALDGIDDATSVAVGRRFVCVATRRGAVFCRGDNTHGQLGARLRAESTDALVPVVGVDGATRVFAGDSHACAIVAGGGVRCWGNNALGQTGGPKVYAREARELVTATAVAGVTGATVLALADTTSCARTESGQVLCWGATDRLREHAAARGVASEEPVVVAGLAGTTDLGASNYLSCGIRDAVLACWGELGALPRSARERAQRAGVDHEPVELGLPPTERVRVGSGHACALHVDGRVSCWGSNGGGALGRGTIDDTDRVDPGPVRGLPEATELFVGGTMACVLGVDDEVHCWGRWPVVDGAAYRQSGTPVKLDLGR